MPLQTCLRSLDPGGGRAVPAQHHRCPPGTQPIGSRLPAEALGPCLEIEVPDGYVWLVYRTAARWSVRALAAAGDIPASRAGA
ncbi:hypothetical protein [Streptomyces sp. NPDC004721]